MIKKLILTFNVLLRVFGGLWLLIEATSFFLSVEWAASIKEYWWVFLGIGVIISAITLRPKKRYKFSLGDRDISIELVIGDIFKEEGPIIIGSNTSFSTDLDVISSKSIQGIYSSEYFPNIGLIDDQINSQVSNLPCEFGTTITIQSNDRIGYWCAIAEINQQNIAQSNMENIRISLAGLWSYLSSNAEKDTFNIPLLGSGFSRVPATRGDLFAEIVRSFIASTSQSTYCDGLRIVVYSKDINKFGIDINEMVKFLDYSCQYQISDPSSEVAGTPET